jgi:hypothetical protein
VLNHQSAYEYEFGSEQRERPQFATDGDQYYRIHSRSRSRSVIESIAFEYHTSRELL